MGDHPAFRKGLAERLADEKDLRVCGEAGNTAQGLEVITRLKPDLVLVDLTLPGGSGLELIKQLRKVNRAVKVLVISIHDEALCAARVLRAGGDDCILQQEDPEETVQAVRDVLQGCLYVSEQVAARTHKTAPQQHAITKISLLTSCTNDSQL